MVPVRAPRRAPPSTVPSDPSPNEIPEVTRSHRSVTERDAEVPRSADDVARLRDPLQMCDSFFERHELNGRRAQRHHASPFAFDRHAFRGRAEPRSQQTIPVRRLPAALEMSQHERACLGARQFGDAVCDGLADTAETSFEPEPRLFSEPLHAANRRRSFRRDHDTAAPPPGSFRKRSRSRKGSPE